MDFVKTLNCIVVVFLNEPSVVIQSVDLLLRIAMQFVNLFRHRLLSRAVKLSCKAQLNKTLNAWQKSLVVPPLYLSKNPSAKQPGPICLQRHAGKMMRCQIIKNYCCFITQSHLEVSD